MANIAVRLSDAADEYVSSSRSRGDAGNTLKTKRGSLDKLILSAGNILVKSVTPAHIDALFGDLHSQNLRASTINLHRTNLQTFFKWCQTRRYINNVVTPMDGTRPLKELPRDHLRVPAAKFSHLLDCAGHPRDRVVISLALYTFMRQSEIKRLRVGDVNLSDGFIATVIQKSSKRDEMPVSKVLERELHSWLTWYASHIDGPLLDSYYLIPVRSRPRFEGRKGGGLSRVNVYDTLTPERHIDRLEGIAQSALERAGFQLRDLDGSSRHVGMHTLRRSGARALYDREVSRTGGHDGVIRVIQAMLHHESVTTTETYLGIDLDIKRRNESIRGEDMFGELESGTVVSLDEVRASEG